MTCKCNGHSRRVWFFRALPSEILVGWLVDGERRGRRICRRKIYIPRLYSSFYGFLSPVSASFTSVRHANEKGTLSLFFLLFFFFFFSLRLLKSQIRKFCRTPIVPIPRTKSKKIIYLMVKSKKKNSNHGANATTIEKYRTS